MRRLAAIPGWLLVVVWLAVPALAITLVVVSLTGDDEDPSARQALGLGTAEVDVQSPELQRQRKAAGISDCPRLATPPSDPGLPSLTLACLGGSGELDLADLSGPLVINVWAQSCSPCRDEMPLLQRLHESSDAVGMLGIDFQDLQPGRAIALAEATGVTYPSVADVEGELKEPPLSVRGLPWTFFVDRDGHVVATERGAFDSYADLTGAVADHLGVTV